LLTAALFGLVPAVKVARTGLETDLRASGRGLGGRKRSVSRALIAAQVALSLPLVLGAGLFARSLRNLLTVDPGFNRKGVLMAHLSLARAGYKDTALATAYQQLLQRIGALPGVRAASLSTYPPLTGGGGTFFSASGVSVDGRQVPATTTGNVYINVIGPRFFETLSTPLLAGRDFTEQDSQGAPRVVIVSEALAREFFPNESAIGHQIQIGQASPPAQAVAPAEIVGIVKTMKYETLRESPHYIVFEPYGQSLDNAGAAYLEVRGATGLGSLAAAVQRVVAETVRQVPVETLTLNDWVNQFLTQDRLTAVLASGFGFLAMLLAAVGLYGVMAYGVAQRTAEIGVRMALGAQRANVLRLVLREGAMLLAIGVAVGLPLALALGRFVTSMLFNLTPSDPVTMSGAAVILAIAGMAAAYVPARRAAAVDPMVALRYE
jgi:putative ABC transport system permease protein